MSNLMELRQAAEYDAQNKMQANPLYGLVQGLGAGFNSGIADEMKRQKEEKTRQDNVKKQMSTFQQMMQTMQSMPDNSTAARGVRLLDDEKNKDRKGITGISTMIPQKEMSIDETGAVNIKLGMRMTTPQEQKAQFEIQKSKMEQEKANAKSQLLDGYIRGDIQEGAILKEMGSLGITPDEFDMAAQARSRFRDVAQNQANAMGQVQPTTQPQPQQAEQPFMFDKSKALQEQKLTGELQDRAETKQNKSQSAIDSAESAIATIQYLEDNINFFGPIEGRMPAGLNNAKREWAKNYEFLEASKILSVISEMKNQSRTGATGFGQLNREELRVLTNAAMKLDKQLDEKAAAKYLNEMKTSFQKIIDREKNGYDFERGGQGQGAPQADQGASVPSVGGSFNGEKVISVKRIR